MKRIEEYIEEELLALTPEEIANTIDYECAELGIPLLPTKPLPYNFVAPSRDIEAYCIGGLRFDNRDAAEGILTVIKDYKVYKEDYSDYNFKYLSELNENDYSYPKIEQASYYTKQRWDEIETELKRQIKLNDEHKEAKKIYDAILEDRSEVVNALQERISTAKHRARRVAEIRAQWKRYLELAENNPSIALNFLLKVQDLREYPELMTEFTEWNLVSE